MKVTPPLFLRIFKFCLTAGLLLFMQSCSHQEDDGSVSLNIPSSVCQRLASRDIGDPTDTMTIFVTGDYEAKKTISFSSDNFPAAGITVEFGGIRAGSKVRVVCLFRSDDDSAYSCKIGVSDEVTIMGGQENAASVKLVTESFEVPSFEGTSDPEMYLTQSLSGCTYKWYFRSAPDVSDFVEVTRTTSEPICYFVGCGITTSSSFGAPLSIHSCTIYCNDTKIITLVHNIS